MTAVEAAAHLSALMVMILRLGRTALPVLRLSNHPAAIAVCVFLPLVPSVIESLGGVATSLELAHALLLAAVNGVGAWRGRELPAAGAALALAILALGPATACAPLQAERVIANAASGHDEACDTYAAIRPALNTPESEAEAKARKAADVACGFRVVPAE